MYALTVQRYDFFSKNAVNLLVVPSTVPGIVTGIALHVSPR